MHPTKPKRPQKPFIDDVILIGDPSQNHQYDFEALTKTKSQQQQEAVRILTQGSNQNIQNHDEYIFIDDAYTHLKTLPESQLQKQFEEIRFGQQCNLMDLDLQQTQTQKSVLQLTPFEYENFTQNRFIQIQTPLLINQGYILSYKLYQIKTTASKNSSESQSHKHSTIKQNQKLSFFHTSNHKPQDRKNLSKNILQNHPSAKKQSSKQETQNKEYNTCVSRRFSDFQYLNQLLIAKYGGYIIPLLPEKNFWTIINLEGKQYAQTRTKSLVKYLTRLFTHKTLKHSEELKNFLFQQDDKFSTQKGEYLQKNKRIEDKIISISSGALEYGKALYSRFLGGGAQKSKSQEEIRLSKSKLTKEDLTFSEYEIVVGELMRIVVDVKALVENTIQQMETIDDINTLFSSGLTDSFNIPTSMPTESKNQSSKIEEISQFISSCHAAIQRRKALRQEMEQLKQQEENLQQKYKNSPRSLELDMVRSKLSKLNKMNETYADELIKELEFHVDEGKGMLRLFVVKFQKVRGEFFGHGQESK